MCDTPSYTAGLQVLQCVDAVGLRLTIHSRMRASSSGVSLLGS